MTDKEKIRAEIERLKKENETYVDKDYAESQKWHMHGAYHVLFELSNFIDSITEEPVSEDLEKAADNCYYHNHAYARESFIEGAQWQKENLWKPADGDDLPEIDREVIALL